MRQSEGGPMSNREKEQSTVRMECLAPDGLGFGEGGISVQEQIESGILSAEVPIHVHELLTTDPNAFKTVEADDDGCGDGRPWIKIMRMEDSEVVECKKSLMRAKVFGGGLVVASSMWRAVNGASGETDSLVQDRTLIARELSIRGFEHGAHTDDHAEGDRCGCGAIDNYPIATVNAVKYRTQITGALEVLYGDEFESNRDAIETVFGVYDHLAEHEKFFAGSTGKQAMGQIIEAGAIVKELYGHHVEETIVVNDVDGTTLDQQYFTQKVKEMSKDKPQVVQAFTVDVWRGRQIAELITSVYGQHNPDVDLSQVYKRAMADFLIRTLAVAGTLTAGDLPVYRRSTVS